ncbi:MAG TPA: HEAT repeat domain-containing protein [Candidatus Eisenbacteria bacterium]|jgi:hypothetical protein
MNADTRLEHESAPADLGPTGAAGAKEQEPVSKAAGTWIHSLGRTLKTCRLYEGQNPTVVRFREDLALALRRLLEAHGAITLRFTSDDVLYEDVSLHPARSRDDNLALLFYRDGVRALTLSPGIEPPEVHAIVDALLQVSGQNSGHDDLVTLLWEAQLSHVEVDYVPADSDVGGTSGEPGAEEAQLVPWPTTTEEPEEESSREGQAAGSATGERGDSGGSRSDDWTTGDLTVEIEAGFEELDSLAPTEVERFRREFEAEHQVSPSATALAIVRAVLSAGATPDDRGEFAEFLPRLLRLAVSRGAWLEAREALGLIDENRVQDWSAETFAQELLQPISVSTAAEFLDRQAPEEVLDFVAFAEALGDPSVDLLNLVLAEAQQRGSRRVLAEAIAELCRDRPQRLSSWLSDRRWFVVRNVVHILSWIGGDTVVGLLRGVVNHPEPRVRRAVAAALGQVDPVQARPLLLKLLENADPQLFSAVLHQLSTERNTAVARLLLAYLQDPAFESRPLEEQRAIYSAIAAAGTDGVIPELEAELLRGKWFARSLESHRQTVARCIARIGTPLARQVLERGAQSKRLPVRKACEEALVGFSRHG